MYTNDLKTIVELMELAGGEFNVVKMLDGKAYSTNGRSMVVREIKDKHYEGYICKTSLPVLKGLLAVNKKNEMIDDDIDHLITSVWRFPSIEQIENVFEQDFKFSLTFDADDLIKAIKAMKNKDNSIILKIKDNASPMCFRHENGKAVIALKS